jgi:hypothetical protein
VGSFLVLLRVIEESLCFKKEALHRVHGQLSGGILPFVQGKEEQVSTVVAKQSSCSTYSFISKWG